MKVNAKTAHGGFLGLVFASFLKAPAANLFALFTLVLAFAAATAAPERTEFPKSETAQEVKRIKP